MDFIVAKGVASEAWKSVTVLESYIVIEYQLVKTPKPGKPGYTTSSIKKVPVEVTKFREKTELVSEEIEIYQEIAYLDNYIDIDIELGKPGVASNDLQLKIKRSDSIYYGLNYGVYIFAPDEEFGGVLEKLEVDTDTNELVWTGRTWRGMLEADIIDPGDNDYKIVSGEANQVIADILSDGCGSFFSVSEDDTGISFTDYQFDRYTSKLKGLTKMLATEGLRLDIRAESGRPNGEFKVWVAAVPIQDMSTEIRYSQDNDVRLRLNENQGGINHLICLGDGELADRLRVDLYVTDKDGEKYEGELERTAVYEYSSVEGETTNEKLANLTAYGKERLKELSSSQSLEMTIIETPGDIGDIITGLDRSTGLTLSKPITKKILRKNQDSETIEHLVEDSEEGTEGIA